MKTLDKSMVAGSLLALLLFAGCAGTPIQFDVLDMQPEKDGVDFSKGRTITGQADGTQLLLFIPIGINDRHERALRNLRQKANGDYIEEIKIQESWTYILVGTIYRTTFEAKAYPYIEGGN
jgi:hypothetical protein